jgi:TonB family protein
MHVPRPSGDLLSAILQRTIIQDPEKRPRRAWSRGIVVGGLATAAAVASAIWVSSDWQTLEQAAVSVAASTGTARPSFEDFRLGPPEDEPLTTSSNIARTLYPSGFADDYFPLLKVAPRYPMTALERQLDGHIVVEFTVTEQGTVRDVSVIESTNAVFNDVAVEAAEQFKYMPRIVDGKPVPVPNVQNRISFRVDDSHPLSTIDFHSVVAPAQDCVEEGDLLCAQLILDEAIATHSFDSRATYELLNFYGFIYSQHQNFEQAIAAYEAAIIEPGAPECCARLTLAHLYFQRQQYQQAMDVTLEYLDSTEEPLTWAYRFVERLRRLGISE